MMRVLLSLLLFFLPISLLLAQAPVLQNNPTSVRWKQINTPGFRVIYQEGFDKEAQHAANRLEHIREPETQTMGGKLPHKVSIVLQNQNAIANGFVTLGPRRSELYTLPPQDYNFLGSNEWLDMLSIHEYRHIVQFEQSKAGWNKLFYYLFGENTQAGMAFAAAPPWFWEGDAVVTETAFTPAGRGRIPDFNRVFRANLLEGKRFGYNKQHLSSYKDLMPNHYVLGYHMVAHLRKRTQDPNIWEKVTHSAFSLPFIPFTFSNALRKHTGKSLIKNYELMMDDMEAYWRKQSEEREPTAFDPVTQRSDNAFTNYYYPQPMTDGRVLVLKDGIGDFRQFVAIDKEGGEHKVYTPGQLNDSGMLSAIGNTLVWNEFIYDPRWQAKSYSVIKTYNIETRKKHTITHHSRYTAAALSPDQAKIVAALNTPENHNFLVVLDVETGTELTRFSNPNNYFYAMPRWSDTGEYIVALKTTAEGRGVVLINALSGQEKELIAPSRRHIGHPVVYGDHLLYNMALGEIDDIFALHLPSGQHFRITTSKYGAYNPTVSLDAQFIYYNDHNIDGLDVVKIPFNPETWRPISLAAEKTSEYIDAVAAQEEAHGNLLAIVQEKEYPVKPYSKARHMFNVHSWGPFASTDLNSAQIGVFSQDVLSTTNLSMVYNYDIQEETGYYAGKLSYQGFFPIIDLEVQRGNRTSDRGKYNNEQVTLKWKETGLSAGLRLPLNFTRSKYIRQLTLENSLGLTKVTDFRNDAASGNREAPINDTLNFIFRDELNNGTLISNTASFSFINVLKTSIRDINPQWGQVLFADYINTPYGGDFTGSIFALNTRFYFPSPLKLALPKIMKHHSLYFRYSYQSREETLSPDLYYFRNHIAKPRGYSYPDHAKFNVFSMNYTFPLWYPDVALGPFLNFKRIRVNGFYDWGRGTGKNYFVSNNDSNAPGRVYYSTLDRTYESMGGELLFDINVMRFPVDISLGLRYAYRRGPQDSKIEFLLTSINF